MDCPPQPAYEQLSGDLSGVFYSRGCSRCTSAEITYANCIVLIKLSEVPDKDLLSRNAIQLQFIYYLILLSHLFVLREMLNIILTFEAVAMSLYHIQ